jgi:hypothetical protein
VARRTQPLSARRDPATVDEVPAIVVEPEVGPAEEIGTVVVPVAPDAPRTNASESGSYQRLAEGIRQIRIGGGSLNLGEHTLMVVAGIVAPLGLIVVFFGWYGAAHSPYLYEQIPYVASGGFLGLGLVFLGAFFYFAHWTTEMVKEHRRHTASMIEALARLEETIKQQVGANRLAGASETGTVSSGNGPVGELVATGKGTMAHRPDCVVVMGKVGLRRVSADDGLASCKLCEPYAEAVPT